MHAFICRSAAAFIAVGAFISGPISPLPAAAQDDPTAPAASAVAAGTGVARVSVIDGTLAIQRGDSSDSLAAAINAPILGGDYVISGDASRAEIQLDARAAVRLDGDVQMRFTFLDGNERSIQLAAGTLDVRIFGGSAAVTHVDTPSITVTPQGPGTYRVTVTPEGTTLVTVRDGDATIVTPQGQTDLPAGQTLAAQGDAATPSTQLQAEVPPDAFDLFNHDRDGVYAAAQLQPAFVNANIGGLEDLNADGSWVVDQTYGNVWVPAGVGPDWAPYRDGRWVWEEGYGWTWLADESWGWAPYHHGSWYRSAAYGWCWYPPQPQARAVWRPALVAFIGFGAGSGGGFALGFAGGDAFGNIGWVPLAPFEPYHPWWGNRYGRAGISAGGYGVTNVTNVTNITNITVYRNVWANAVTSVSSERFIQGNFSAKVAVSEPELRTAHVFSGAVPVVPTAANLRFTNNSAPPPVALRGELLARPFAGNRSAVERTPFTAQRSALAAATHADVTPLNFRDAQSTPLPSSHPASAGAATTLHAAPITTAPAHATAPTGAWERFGAARAPEIIDGARVRTTTATVPAAASQPQPHAATVRAAGNTAAPKAVKKAVPVTKPEKSEHRDDQPRDRG